MNALTRFLSAACAALLMSGCGGGGGTASMAGINGGGAPAATSGFAKGTITGFGSIFVNGVEFATTGAQIVIDDNPGTESDLRIGQVVTVQGTVNANGTGTATRVVFDNEIKGPVASIDAAAGTFVVLGQTVRVNGTTTFDDSSLAGGFTALAAGDVVEVSGFRNAAGELVATRVERRTGGVTGPFEINGVATDVTATTFRVGTLVVSYTGVVPTDGTLANGVCVQVKGTTVVGLQLTATSVEIKRCGLGATNGARGEVEGIITVFRSSSDFDIGGQRVITTAATTIVTNGLAGALRADIKVEAEGSFDANGVLVATRIEVKPETTLRLVGNIESIDAANNTIRVNGVVVQAGSGTRFEDKSDARVKSFRFADLRTGDYLEIRGFAGAAADSIQAAILEREDPDDRMEIQGFARNLADPTLVILGVTVDTTGAQFRNVSDAPMSRSEFFAQAAGKLVKARGAMATPVFLANDEVQLESP